MPSHATIRFCSTPEGVLVAESVADGAMGGTSTSHRSDAASFLFDGVKAGDSVILGGAAPLIVTGLGLVAARNTQLDITWNGGGSARFRIRYRVALTTLWILDNPTGVSPLVTTYTITELPPATSWEIVVTRWDPVLLLESPFSSILAVSTL